MGANRRRYAHRRGENRARTTHREVANRNRGCCCRRRNRRGISHREAVDGRRQHPFNCSPGAAARTPPSLLCRRRSLPVSRANRTCWSDRQPRSAVRRCGRMSCFRWCRARGARSRQAGSVIVEAGLQGTTLVVANSSDSGATWTTNQVALPTPVPYVDVSLSGDGKALDCRPATRGRVDDVDLHGRLCLDVGRRPPAGLPARPGIACSLGWIDSCS